MIDVYEIIANINRQKKDNSTVPPSALYSEIMNDVSRQVKEEVNALYRDKKITFNKTLNELSFDAK